MAMHGCERLWMQQQKDGFVCKKMFFANACTDYPQGPHEDPTASARASHPQESKYDWAEHCSTRSRQDIGEIASSRRGNCIGANYKPNAEGAAKKSAEVMRTDQRDGFQRKGKREEEGKVKLFLCRTSSLLSFSGNHSLYISILKFSYAHKQTTTHTLTHTHINTRPHAHAHTRARPYL